MTLQALPTQPEVWRPSPGYHCAALQEDSKARAVSTVEDEADEYWKEWWQKCDRLMKLQVPPPNPAGRLARYQNKPVQELPPVPPLPTLDAQQKVVMVEQPQPPRTGSWTGQKIDFPRDFEDDMDDWVQLEPVSPRRDQVWREVAMIEMMAMGQMGMGQPPEMLPMPEPTSGVAGDLPAPAWKKVTNVIRNAEGRIERVEETEEPPDDAVQP